MAATVESGTAAVVVTGVEVRNLVGCRVELGREGDVEGVVISGGVAKGVTFARANLVAGIVNCAVSASLEANGRQKEENKATRAQDATSRTRATTTLCLIYDSYWGSERYYFGLHVARVG